MPPSIHVFNVDCLRKTACSEEVMPFVSSLPVQFERCYSSGTWTVPSHASLFSGQNVLEHGISGTGDVTGKQDSELPRTAKQNGYKTAIFSENPSFSPRTGFGHFIDSVHDNIQHKPFPSTFSPREYLDSLSVQGSIDLATELIGRPNRLANLGNTSYIAYNEFRNPEPTYPHHGEWVLSHQQSYLAATDEPVLTITNILDPHNPYWGSPPSQELSRSKSERSALRSAGWNLRYILTDADPPEVIQNGYTSWSEFLAAKAAIYRRFSCEADRLLERWHQQQRDQFNSGLVVTVGDHGQLFGAEGMVGHHNSLHPHGIHVPLAIDPPTTWNQSGRTLTTPVSIAGLGRALIDVAAGKITSTNDLIDAIKTYSGDATGTVIVCADGPAWSMPPLYEDERFNDDLIDDLAVRRVGYISEKQVDIYSSRWDATTVESTSYIYTEANRERLPNREPPPAPEEAKSWLTVTQNPRTDRRTVDHDRLEALGYI